MKFSPMAKQQLVVVLVFALHAVALGADVGVRDVIPGIGEYYFGGIAVNWTTAYRQCQASGGHLAVINSEAEKEALQEMMTRHGADNVLVGFHDQFVEGVYTFITGWSLSTSDSLWLPGAPIGGESNNCGFLNADGIYDSSCSLVSKFICELSEDQGGEDNGDGYSLLDGFGYYKRHVKYYTWSRAWDTCRQERSDLLVLDSEAEVTALWNANVNFGYVWLGIHRQWGPDDNFVSLRNTPLSALGYQKWATADEPVGDYQTTPYLVQIGRNGMGALPGTFTTSFFCKRPL